MIEIRVQLKITKTILGRNPSPFVVISEYVNSAVRSSKHELGRTEVVKGTKTAHFQKYISIKDTGERFFIIEVFTMEDSPQSLGWCKTTLHDILDSNRVLSLPFGVNPGEKNGELKVFAEETREFNVMATFTFKASGLAKKEVFSGNIPYFTISRVNEGGVNTVVYTSPKVGKTNDPIWPSFDITMSELCGCDPRRTLRIDVWHHTKKGGELIGGFELTFEELVLDRSQVFPLVNEKGRVAKSGAQSGILQNYHDSGKFMIQSASVQNVPSFSEYVKDGLILDFSVAVDFSGSIDMTEAVENIGHFVEMMTKGEPFPAYGFGAHPQASSALHVFNLNNQQSPLCSGNALVKNYVACKELVVRNDNTKMEKVIDRILEEIKVKAKIRGLGKYYSVLIILTASKQDNNELVNAISASSGSPLSIVFVAVGDDAFKIFRQFQSEEWIYANHLNDKVPFSNAYSVDSTNESLHAKIEERVLDQVLRFMLSKRVGPNNEEAERELHEAINAKPTSCDGSFSEEYTPRVRRRHSISSRPQSGLFEYAIKVSGSATSVEDAKLTSSPTIKKPKSAAEKSDELSPFSCEESVQVPSNSSANSLNQRPRRRPSLIPTTPTLVESDGYNHNEKNGHQKDLITHVGRIEETMQLILGLVNNLDSRLNGIEKVVKTIEKNTSTSEK